MLFANDFLEVQNLINLYGHIVDQREFSRVNELFTDETLYDVSDFDSGVHRGAAAIAKLWSSAGDKHPLAHHATNIMISENPDGTVNVVSKGMGVRRNGTVGSVTYRDIVARTAAGWRILQRTATLRRPETIPQPS